MLVFVYVCFFLFFSFSFSTYFEISFWNTKQIEQKSFPKFTLALFFFNREISLNIT